MALPDLRGMAGRLNDFMSDTIRITHNPLGLADDGMDDDTGEPLAPSGIKLIWHGKGLIVPFRRGNYDLEGDNPLELVYYVCIVPLECAAPQAGDDVLIVKSPRDPSLTGREMTVAQLFLGTFRTCRRMMIQERSAARLRDFV